MVFESQSEYKWLWGLEGLLPLLRPLFSVYQPRRVPQLPHPLNSQGSSQEADLASAGHLVGTQPRLVHYSCPCNADPKDG